MKASTFGIFVGRLLRSHGLTSSETLTLIGVASSTDDAKICRSSVAKLSQKTKQDRKTVYAALKSLREKGFLEYSIVDGRPTVYFVAKPDTEIEDTSTVIHFERWANFFSEYGFTRSGTARMIDYLRQHYGNSVTLTALLSYRDAAKKGNGVSGDYIDNWLNEECQYISRSRNESETEGSLDDG